MGRSQILVDEIERPRVGPMRDIVATIQPEQDEIVRADAATTVCVQGAPGTGKTAVGLHRAAWLLYAFRDRLLRSGVLVVGPNRAFLDHIGAVLPALGEVEVGHTTAEELVGSGGAVRGRDTTAAAVLKGDARLAAVLERAVWSTVRPAAEALVVPRGSPQVASARIHGHRGAGGAARAGDPLRGGPAGPAAAAGAPRAAGDGAQRRLAGRPRAGLGRAVGGGAGVRGSGVAEARPAAGAVRAVLVGRERSRSTPATC